MYILTSAQTYSAACVFATLARVNKRAVLVGTRAGGNVHFMDAALLLQYRLPHTGILFSVPVCEIRLDFADSLPDERCAQVEPDLRVDETPALQMFLHREPDPLIYTYSLHYLENRH